jgi:hypothetical protein
MRHCIGGSPAAGRAESCISWPPAPRALAFFRLRPNLVQLMTLTGPAWSTLLCGNFELVENPPEIDRNCDYRPVGLFKSGQRGELDPSGVVGISQRTFVLSASWTTAGVALWIKAAKVRPFSVLSKGIASTKRRAPVRLSPASRRIAAQVIPTPVSTANRRGRPTSRGASRTPRTGIISWSRTYRSVRIERPVRLEMN